LGSKADFARAWALSRTSSVPDVPLQWLPCSFGQEEGFGRICTLKFSFSVPDDRFRWFPEALGSKAHFGCAWALKGAFSLTDFPFSKVSRSFWQQERLWPHLDVEANFFGADVPSIFAGFHAASCSQYYLRPAGALKRTFLVPDVRCLRVSTQLLGVKCILRPTVQSFGARCPAFAGFPAVVGPHEREAQVSGALHVFSSQVSCSFGQQKSPGRTGMLGHNVWCQMFAFSLL
jgi:hypothetical protein